MAWGVMMGLVACSAGPTSPGESCDERAPCPQGLACVSLEPDGVMGVCLDRCDPSLERLCDDGSVCSTYSGSRGVCNQVGGATKTGQACAASGECEVGAVCLEDISGEAAGHCWRACDPENPATCTPAQECKAYGAGGLAVCQERLLAACRTGDAEERCAEGYACGVSPDVRTVQEFTAFASRCTISGCMQDTDCPTDSVCRQFNGHYDAAMKSFTPPTREAATQRYCYATCEGQDACGVLSLYTCLSSRQCDASTNAALCKAFLDDASLCVPDMSAP